MWREYLTWASLLKRSAKEVGRFADGRLRVGTGTLASMHPGVLPYLCEVLGGEFIELLIARHRGIRVERMDVNTGGFGLDSVRHSQ